MVLNHPLVRVSWECPLCGANRSSIQQPSEESRGKGGLLNHIRQTNDETHGNWRDVPDDLDVDALDDHLTVEPVQLK